MHMQSELQMGKLQHIEENKTNLKCELGGKPGVLLRILHYH